MRCLVRIHSRLAKTAIRVSALAAAALPLSGCAGRDGSVATPAERDAKSAPSAPPAPAALPSGTVTVVVTGKARVRRNLYIEVDVVNGSTSQAVEIRESAPLVPHLLVEELRNGEWTPTEFAYDNICADGQGSGRLHPGLRLPAAKLHTTSGRVPVRVGVQYRAPGAAEWQTAWSDTIE